MRLSELKVRKEQSYQEICDYTDIQLFSDDLSTIGGERIIESKLLFHGAFAAQETKGTARDWDLRLQVVHLGDFWTGYKNDPERNKKARVGFLDANRDEEPDWHLTPNDYLERTRRSHASINNNVLAIRTEHSVVIVRRHWGCNESSQYPEQLRNIDNELNIFRTGSYSVYRFSAEQWGQITKERSLGEWDKEFQINSALVVVSWQGFGNI